MRQIPKEKTLDSTLAFAADPYRFISRKCQQLGSDSFETRLLLRKVVCMLGEEAAQIFYDEERFMRKGASPARFQRTLFGVGGVQGLDDAAHRHRKAMYAAIFSDERIADLVDHADRGWRASADDWSVRRSVELYHEARSIFFRAVCDWAGVPLSDGDFDQRRRDVTRTMDRAGSIGLRHLSARMARRRCDRWITEVIKRIRAGKINPRPESAAAIIASHRDLDGKLLEPEYAAVDLLNVLRPTLAVAVFVTFAAVALHEQPEYRTKIAAGNTELVDHFVLEVQRFFPFFPVLTAIVRKDFEWRDYRFAKGTGVLLDLYGTNHDPRIWDRPDAFRPERFEHQTVSPFNFIPHGGGDSQTGHRCAGEVVTRELLKNAIQFLCTEIDYQVPPQELELNFKRLPALPKSLFVMEDVRVKPSALPKHLQTFDHAR